MADHNIKLIYEGEVNQSITMAFTAIAEKQLAATDLNTTIKKRIYHVMVECLQNICKHADDPTTGEPGSPGHGVFLVSFNEQEYIISTGNIIANSRIKEVEAFVTNINRLERPELNELFKTRMKETKLSDKGGAGLGFIDMVRKTGKGIDIHFEPVNDLVSFVVIKSTVPRELPK